MSRFAGSPSTLSERLCGGPDYVLRTVLPVHGGPPEAAGQVKNRRLSVVFPPERTAIGSDSGIGGNRWQFSRFSRIKKRKTDRQKDISLFFQTYPSLAGK